MGLLDGILSFVSWVNTHFNGWLPQWAVLSGWGAVTSCMSMSIYLLCSSQTRLANIKTEILAARKAVMDYDDDFSNLWIPVKRLLGLSFKQVGLTVLPALAGAAPVILMIIWVGSACHYEPVAAGQAARISIYPTDAGLLVQGDAPSFLISETGVISWPDKDKQIELVDSKGETVAIFPLKKAIPVVAKYQWWNQLLGNPNGYIPESSPVERIEIDLPLKEYFPVGPGWARTAEAIFLFAVLIVSLAIKYGFKIQ